MASGMANSELLSKFRGCMIGSLIGDCLGAPFELRSYPSSKTLGKFFSNLLTGGSTRMFASTDDTSMVISVARSLIENKKVEPKDLAKRFVDEYFRKSHFGPGLLGYGANVIHVFHALKDTNFENVFLPGQKQFGGSGSYGNGAAMRIAPMALFDLNKTDEDLQSDVELCSRITHNHPYGYNGAVLQCLAVKAALKSDSSKEFDPVDFISQLEKKMENIKIKANSPFSESLKKIKKYLESDEDISARDIAKNLGNDETAKEAVPTAIYCFLRGMKPISEFECQNPFVRTIYFAFSVGGDTDTIGAMAGSIAGAYYGIDSIPTELQERCEFKDEVDDLAYKLYDLSQEVSS